MTAYRYKASDASGVSREGRIEAEQEKEARALLRAQGLWVVDLLPETQGRRPSLRLSTGRLAFLVRQWACLLEAGLTVEQSLDALIGQCDHEAERRMLAEVRGAVRAGDSLARALGHHPGCFDESFRALVDAGENAGRLPQLLDRMADHLEARRAMQQKVGLALLYPAIVILVASGVIAALLAWVVPQVVEVFAGSRQVLPLPTRVLVFLSDLLRELAPWLLGALLPLAGAAVWWLRRPGSREKLHPFLMRLPLVGRLLHQADAGRVATALGVLTEAGVPLLSALEIAARTARLAPLRMALQRAGRAVREGASLSRALAAEPLFPPLIGRLAAVGEASGRLGRLLGQAGRQLDNETAFRSAWLAGILEPLTILVMGGVVLSIVLAVLLPIINMNQMIR